MFLLIYLLSNRNRL